MCVSHLLNLNDLIIAIDFLDTSSESSASTSTIDVPSFNKTGRGKDKFSRINWLRDETLKEKNKKEKAETTTSKTILITPEKTTRAADLMTTKRRTTTNPSVPLDPINMPETSTKKYKNLSAPTSDITTENVKWILGKD